MKKCKCGDNKKIGGKTCGSQYCICKTGYCDVENCFVIIDGSGTPGNRRTYMCDKHWVKYDGKIYPNI